MNPLALAQKEVMANLGRNVAMFQALETTMKQLVQLLMTARVVSIEGVGKRHAKVQKMTLGQLLGEILKKLKFDDPEFANQYETLVEQRNTLVHHFGEVYGKDLKTEEGCADVIVRLEMQFELVREWRRTLHGFLSVTLVCVCETQFHGTDEYADMRTLCEQLISQIDPKYLPELAIEPA